MKLPWVREASGTSQTALRRRERLRVGSGQGAGGSPELGLVHVAVGNSTEL